MTITVRPPARSPRGSASNKLAKLVSGNGGGVLQLSMRRIHDLVAFCLPYEFEDVVADVTGADRVEPDNFQVLELARRVYKLTRFASGSQRIARAMVSWLNGPQLARAKVPWPNAPRLTRDYDLFFPVFNHAYELFALFAVPDWRKRCRSAACFISEIWLHEMPDYLLELLAKFDHIFLGVRHPTEEIARIVGRPCTYLPLAVDVLRFAPHPNPPPRSIDICNIGRRSPVTHAALLKLACDRRIFYYYDTVHPSGEGGRQMTFRVQSAREHRLLLANVLKRSRYYVANRARVNEPEIIEGKEEISARFYEGVAAGTVLIGEAPRSDEFRRQFDWPDAVIRMPFDSTDAADILERIDADPPRIERIRLNNVQQAARRHDWVHRLRVVYETLGIRPTEAMLAREEQLRSLATLAYPAQGDAA
jgi:glycosyl transferase family 1